MSTKIYCAYRFPLDRASEGVEHFHSLLLKQAIEPYDLVLNTFTEEMFQHLFEAVGKGILAPKAEPGEELTIRKKMLSFSDLMVAGDKDTRRLFDRVTCGFNCWVHSDGFMYIIIVANFNHSLESETHPEWVENFSYWNNTDPPEGFDDEAGYKRWEARGEKWAEVGPGGYDPGFYRGRLYHEVVETSHLNGMMELQNEYCDHKKIKRLYSL